MIRITITQVIRTCPRSSDIWYDDPIEHVCNDKESALCYLRERYGRLPNGRNKVYRDCVGETYVEIGITHSYWDVHRNYHTDWICFAEFWEREVSYAQLKKVEVGVL